MTDKDRWELRIKFFGAVFAGLSIVASVFIYLDGNRATLERENNLIAKRDELQYQRDLWDERRAAYRTLAATLGSMAAELDAGNTISNATRSAVNTAYWGTLVLVESDAVEMHMVRLRNDLRDFERGRIDADKIRQRIHAIVEASRLHLKEVGDGALQ
ncbi:hypothetical protein EBB79_15000 [Parasedimentitalea marina]|uniref:Uncharacterized protein n=1 Tax=Parasedimentitalea marina TaxID=2483033 RepID=A0A3T0N502_9RHOB|nr:hypothetical protein [Parasedimentitalea marina]AZV79049.1 hypothetical protein EBB79_15000 [Parasedimentitalea marina]